MRRPAWMTVLSYMKEMMWEKNRCERDVGVGLTGPRDDSMRREEKQLEITMLIWVWKEVANIKNLTTLTTKSLTKASPGAISERTGCYPPSKCILLKLFLSWRKCILLLHSWWWKVFMGSLISPGKKKIVVIFSLWHAPGSKIAPDRARSIYSVHYDILIPQLAHIDLPDCKGKPSFQI